jgi:hypothetical protein
MNAVAIPINHNSVVHVFNISSFNRTTLKFTTPICQPHSYREAIFNSF